MAVNSLILLPWELGTVSPLLESGDCFYQLSSAEMTLHDSSMRHGHKELCNFDFKHSFRMLALEMQPLCCEKPRPYQGTTCAGTLSLIESSLWSYQFRYQTHEWRSHPGSGFFRPSCSCSWCLSDFQWPLPTWCSCSPVFLLIKSKLYLGQQCARQIFMWVKPLSTTCLGCFACLPFPGWFY